MGRLVITTFLSLDGVMDEPQDWSLAYWNDEIAAFKDQEMRDTAILLLGRVTYETFAEAWPSRSGDYADRLNTLPKRVVSDSLQHADWAHSTILRGEGLATQIEALRAEADGDVVVHGSRRLAQWLIRQGFVDELRLLVSPIALGSGARLLDGLPRFELAKLNVQAFSSGATLFSGEPRLS